MSIEKRWPSQDDQFMRDVVFSEEDRGRFTRQPWDVGTFRWFRSDNVTPIEHYRRAAAPTPTPAQKPFEK